MNPLARLVRGTRPTWQVALGLALFLFFVQLSFTALIRGYVVPHLTPGVHWRYGLTTSSDSQVFHQEAISLARRMRTLGWREVNHEQFQGMGHTKILASIYYISGSDSPYFVYVVNALLLAATGLLVFALLLRVGIRRSVRAALGAALITCGPMILFAHSELLREPFILPALLIFVLGLLALLAPARLCKGPEKRKQWVAAAALVTFGFMGASTFRPYLVLPLLVALAVSIGATIVVIAVGRRRSPFTVHQVVVLIALTGVLLGAHVVPSARGATRYSDKSVLAEASPAISGSPTAVVTNALGEREVVDLDIWKETVAAKREKETLTRADFMLPHWCTIQWQRTGWLPNKVDDKLEALACARQDYLRFCDQSILGSRADRNCDAVDFTSAGAVAAHVPRAAAFVFLVPFPEMWLESFGGGGTGLRRVGYVIDGVLDYALLSGLVLCGWRVRRSNPEILVVAAAIAAMLTIYGLAVPTQFILARLRLAMFTPLLALGAACWLRLFQDRGVRLA